MQTQIRRHIMWRLTRVYIASLQDFPSKMNKNNKLDPKMTNGLVQHITVEESTSIKWVRADLWRTVRLKSPYFSATKNNISGTKIILVALKLILVPLKLFLIPLKLIIVPLKYRLLSPSVRLSMFGHFFSHLSYHSLLPFSWRRLDID